MGKAGRFVCIFTPWALTLASFICLALVEISGWNTNTLPGYHFVRANFTDLSIPNADTDLAASLQVARKTVGLGDIYHINLWNYCSSNTSQTTLDYCSPRTSEFYFDPMSVWGLNNSAVSTSTSSSGNAVESAVNTLKSDRTQLENKVLGDSAQKALDAYRTVSKWMFIAYQASFWTTLATLLVSITAVFSRWGSLLTWILSIASTLFTFAAVLTSTVLFSVLVAALKGVLHTYQVSVSLGTHALTVAWLAVACSVAASLFWLFSICCCSGRSNPHHKDNKGGLWNAEPKGQGYETGHRALSPEKTDYSRVDNSPISGVGGEEDDRVPLQPYPRPQQQQHQYEQSPYGYDYDREHAYEPYRHD